MRWSDLILHWTDRLRWLVLAVIVIVYLLGFTGVWRPEPDAALYLSLGRNLAEGKGYVYHDQVHRLAYPGWPWVLAGLFKLFGDRAVFAAHVTVLLMGFASLALMYRLMLLHAGRPTAVLVTFGLAISRTFYRYCFELRSDIPFMLGVMAVLAGYEGLVRRGEMRSSDDRGETASGRRRSRLRLGLDLSLLVGGVILGLVTRPTMWPILAALMVAVVWDIFRGRLSKKLLLILAIVPLCGVLFLAVNPRASTSLQSMGGYEEDVVHRMSWDRIGRNLHTVLDPMASAAMFGLDFGEDYRVGGFSINALGSVATLAIGLSMFRRRALWGLVVLFTLLMMVSVLALDRYFLPILPILVYGWWLAIRWVNFNLPRRWGNTLFLLLFAVGAVPNAAKIGDLFIEQRHGNPMVGFRGGKFASTQKVADMIHANVPENGWVIGPKKMERILTFLSRRNVLERHQAGWVDAGKAPVFVLRPLEFETGSDLPNRLGPEIARVKGPYDLEAWTLHRVK